MIEISNGTYGKVVFIPNDKEYEERIQEKLKTVDAETHYTVIISLQNFLDNIIATLKFEDNTKEEELTAEIAYYEDYAGNVPLKVKMIKDILKEKGIVL